MFQPETEPQAARPGAESPSTTPAPPGHPPMPAGSSASGARAPSAADGRDGQDRRYLAPGALDNLFSRLVRALTGLGVSAFGSRVLVVRGRSSGTPRSTAVNLLVHGGQRYLVAPRGHTQWVRNLRAAGSGELRLGRRAERFVAHELADADKPAVLRAYLRRWKFEVGRFFDGIDDTATDEELLGVASGFPVFRVDAF